MTPEEYCQQRAAASGSSFYHSFRFLEPHRRRAIVALYAFCREVDDVVDECRDISVAAAKLEWWRAEVAAIFHGVPQHPVGRALKPWVGEFRLDEAHFQAIIDGMAMDLEPGRRYQTFDELRLYCHRAAGVVGLLAAAIFGYENPRTLEYAEELGLALQLTNILRDIREDLLRGRLYLPLDELQRFGVDEAALQAVIDGEPDEAIRALLAFQAERAERHYQRAFELLPEADRYHQLSGVVMADIYHALLERIVQRGYPVLRERVALSLPHKLWLAWSSVRRERRRRKAFERG